MSPRIPHGTLATPRRVQDRRSAESTSAVDPGWLPATSAPTRSSPERRRLTGSGGSRGGLGPVSTDPSTIGLTRLGNPANGDAPRPRGACRVLMIGDMIGKPGRIAVEQLLPGLREARGIDFVTANGENVAGGMGLTPSTAEAMFASGVDVITSGNHIWDKREIYPY